MSTSAKTLRVLIVDDEPLAREGIRALLQKESDVSVVGECADGLDAVQQIDSQRPDLVFLDVQMPELDGFGVLRSIEKDALPVVVFVTAFDKYAIEAFSVRALDYLLKPLDPERFHAALVRAREHFSNGHREEYWKRIVDHFTAQPRTTDRLVVKNSGRIFFLRTDEIDWVEAAADYVRLHVGKDQHLIRETLTEMESRLDPSKFLRIHRSTIVNLDRVKEMQPLFSGDYVVILTNGTKLTLSRTHRDKLASLLQKPL